MKISRHLIASTTLIFASMTGTAFADLRLTGTTEGFFQASPNPNTTIVNSPEGMTA